MASKSPQLVGVHFTRHELASGTRWYVYAWRGGPKIMTAEQVLKPALTPEAVAAYSAAHADKVKPRKDTFASLVEAYLASPDYLGLSAGTKRNWRGWLAIKPRSSFSPSMS